MNINVTLKLKNVGEYTLADTLRDIACQIECGDVDENIYDGKGHRISVDECLGEGEIVITPSIK